LSWCLKAQIGSIASTIFYFVCLRRFVFGGLEIRPRWRFVDFGLTSSPTSVCLFLGGEVVSYKRTPPPPISMYQNILFSLLIEVVPLCGSRRLSYLLNSVQNFFFCLVSLFLIFNIIRGKSQHFPTIHCPYLSSPLSPITEPTMIFLVLARVIFIPYRVPTRQLWVFCI